MKLMAYQLGLLKDRYNLNKERISDSIKGNIGITDGLNRRPEDEHININERIEVAEYISENQQIQNWMNTAEILSKYYDETIELGTTFNVSFLDDIDFGSEEVFTLIERKVATESIQNGFITLDSDIGKAVYRKQIGDSFAYETEQGVLVSGMITKIYTKEEHQARLREIQKANKKQLQYVRTRIEGK